VKIPFLGSIPLIGGLFRHRITQNSKTVRIFLIQPREISSENASEANTLSPEMFTSTPLRDWKQNFSMSLL
jgi:type II secretory pathway component GspD/PulD (secretin)